MTSLLFSLILPIVDVNIDSAPRLPISVADAMDTNFIALVLYFLPIKLYSKGMLVRLLKILIPVTLLSFMIWQLYKNWATFENYSLSVSLPLFAVSLVLYVFTVIVGALLWHSLLSHIAQTNIGYKKAIVVSLYAWLARYIPGKIASAIGKIVYGNRVLAIPKQEIAKSVGLEYVFLFTGSLSFILLFFNFKFIFFVVFLAILAASAKFKILIFQNAYVLSRAFLGFSFFILLSSVYSAQISDMPYLVSSFVIASALGFFAIFAPSGLGVREGFLVIFLNKLYPLEVAIAISLFARVWTVVGDMILFGIVSFVRQKIK